MWYWCWLQLPSSGDHNQHSEYLLNIWNIGWLYPPPIVWYSVVCYTGHGAHPCTAGCPGSHHLSILTLLNHHIKHFIQINFHHLSASSRLKQGAAASKPPDKWNGSSAQKLWNMKIRSCALARRGDDLSRHEREYYAQQFAEPSRSLDFIDSIYVKR